jgi:hypothetical protein
VHELIDFYLAKHRLIECLDVPDMEKGTDLFSLNVFLGLDVTASDLAASAG